MDCKTEIGRECTPEVLELSFNHIAHLLTISYSWEFGTRAQVLIEYDSDSYDVLSQKASIPPNATAPSSLDTPLSIARTTVQSKPASQQPLMNDGSVADPASLGVIVLIANWTGQRDADYGTAASQQLDYLLNKAPRTSTGAISHRSDKTQLVRELLLFLQSAYRLCSGPTLCTWFLLF